MREPIKSFVVSLYTLQEDEQGSSLFDHVLNELGSCTKHGKGLYSWSNSCRRAGSSICLTVNYLLCSA